MASRPFLSHTLVTASAGGRNLVRGCYVSRRLGRRAAKLSLNPLRGHDEDDKMVVVVMIMVMMCLLQAVGDMLKGC